MSLKDNLTEELKKALKGKDEERVTVLRCLLSQIKDAQIERKADLTDEEIIKLLRKQVKQRDESIDLYGKANREDLAGKEKREKKIIESFLPAQLGKQELERIIDQVILEAQSDNFGEVIGRVMKKTAGKADGKLVSQIVSQRLKKPDDGALAD